MLIRITKTLLLTFLILIICTSDVNAQNKKNNYRIGISGGLLLFYGDIKVNDFLPAFSNNNE